MKLVKKSLKFFIILILIGNANCTHNQNLSKTEVNLNETESAFSHVLKPEKIEIRSTIYSKTKFPLNEFFEKLLAGDFNESIKKIDLSFKPTNANNEILHKLLEEDIVPAYVLIKNTSSEDIRISYDHFYLSNNTKSVQAFSPEYLPNRVLQITSESGPTKRVQSETDRNIGETVGIVVGTVIFFMLLAILGVENLNAPIGGGPSSRGPHPSELSTQEVTKIDYKNYLIQEKTLKPGEQVYGLLFFSLKKVKTPHTFQLEYK